MQVRAQAARVLACAVADNSVCKQGLLSFWTDGQGVQQQLLEHDMNAVLQQALMQDDDTSGMPAVGPLVQLTCAVLTSHQYGGIKFDINKFGLFHVLYNVDANMVVPILTSTASYVNHALSKLSRLF